MKRSVLLVVVVEACVVCVMLYGVSAGQTTGQYRPSAHLVKAQELFRSGDYREAVLELELLLRRDPRNLTALHLLHDCYIALGEFRKAADALERYVRIAPYDLNVRNELDHLYQLIGSPKRAVDIFTEGKESREALRRWIHLSRVLGKRGKYTEALEALCKAMRIVPYNETLHSRLIEFLRGIPERHRAQVQSWLEQETRSKPYDVELLLVLGLSYQLAGQYEKAEQTYYSVLKKAPGHLLAVYGLVGVLMNQREYRQAARIIESVIQQYPRNAELRFRLAECYSVEGRYEDALEQYQWVTEILPRNAALAKEAEDRIEAVQNYILEHATASTKK